MSYKNGCHIATGCIHIYIIHTCTNTHISTYVHTYKQTNIHTYTHTYTCTYVRTYILTHTNTQENEDTDFHKEARIQSQEPVDTSDDTDFTIEEIWNAVENVGNKKAPGEDGITGEIYKSNYEFFPCYITALHKGCLRRGVFPTRWKRAKLIPIKNLGKKTAKTYLNFVL